MTVLEQYQRLECQGLWRDSSSAQRQEVVVSLGESSLIITDKASRPVSHWSLPAITSKSISENSILYQPGGDAQEELELDDATMIEAIEAVRSSIARRQAHPGRLRTGIFLAVTLLVFVAAAIWLPNAIMRYTASVVPPTKRVEVGNDVLAQIHRLTGKECQAAQRIPALLRLTGRLDLPAGARIEFLASGTRTSAHLPGDLFLMNRMLVEDHDAPEVLAGYVVAEGVRARKADPLLSLLEHAGLFASFRLLTTGDLPAQTLADYGEYLLTGQPEPVSQDQLISAFASAELPAGPYAYAVDLTGEETLGLIEADPFSGGGAPTVISDADWVTVQGICGQ